MNLSVRVAVISNFLYKNRAVFTIGALFFFTLSALLYWNAQEKGHFEVDSVVYDRVAKEFVKTGNVQEPGGGSPVHTQGYHFFLGMVYWITGIDVWKLVLIQVILMFLAILFIVHMSFMLFGQQCARLVFLLALVDPGFYVYPQFLLAETLQLFFISICFERLAAFYAIRKRWMLVVAGIALGFSIIVKPTALFFPIGVALVFLILSKWMTSSLRASDWAFFTAATYVPIFLYVIRNGLLFGYYKFAFLAEANIYHWFNGVIHTHLSHKPLLEILSDMNQKLDSNYSPFDPEHWQPLKDLFFQTCFSHPLVLLYALFQNITKTFFGLYSVQLHLLFDSGIRGNIQPFFEVSGSFFEKIYGYLVWAFRNPYVGVLMLFELVTNMLKWFLCAWGLKGLWDKKSYELIIFFVCVVGCFAIMTGFYGAGRYRLMFEPIILCVASYGLLELYKIYKRIKLESAIR